MTRCGQSLALLAFGALHLGALAGAQDPAWDAAQARGTIHADCGRSARRLLRGWLEQKQDAETHLYSREGTWDYHNEAADHYSSLVLIAFYVEPGLIERGGALHSTLASSQRLCSTPSGIPTTYDLKRRAQGRAASLGELAEWLRDGLVRIVEVVGTENDWFREMERLTDALLAEAERRGGMFAAFRGHEAAGSILQTLARLYALSAKEPHLRAAEELADAFLLEPRHAIGQVRFGDHGCELVPGLAELFALECQLARPKAKAYQKPLQRLLDRILESGAHPETGLFCENGGQPPDTWGYVLFAYENYDRATGSHLHFALSRQVPNEDVTPGRYRAAIEKPLRWLARNRASYPALRSSLWPRSSSSDDWSDSYESMIVLWNRFPRVEGAFEWLDWATLQHVHRRHPDREYGPFTGGHFDGSTGRTLVLHMMACSQGVRCVPFTEGLRLGGVQRDGTLFLVLDSDVAWRGRLRFDGPRAEHKGARLDWARINEMPQWFVARPRGKYSVAIGAAEPATLTGSQLSDGLEVAVEPRKPCRILVKPLSLPGPP
ncbi:MAG TPA: hypothetical protein VNE39_06735 [Planctomycetota bacterium]|nr:hypothetical protein [Planctomycetota bacterium]